jgi:hypothetical protein
MSIDFIKILVGVVVDRSIWSSTMMVHSYFSIGSTLKIFLATSSC